MRVLRRVSLSFSVEWFQRQTKTKKSLVYLDLEKCSSEHMTVLCFEVFFSKLRKREKDLTALPPKGIFSFRLSLSSRGEIPIQLSMLKCTLSFGWLEGGNLYLTLRMRSAINVSVNPTSFMRLNREVVQSLLLLRRRETSNSRIYLFCSWLQSLTPELPLSLSSLDRSISQETPVFWVFHSS